MAKEVIYIDVDDDITSIATKLKKSKADVVALVPPKRIGVLRSAVNLRILKKTADSNDKKIILVTSSSALSPLAADAKIPVSKSLQDKPELLEIDALQVNNDDGIIDGSEFADEPTHKTLVSTQVKPASKKAKTEDLGPEEKPKKKRGGKKVPDFHKFRKKLLLGIVALVLLAGFLVWATVYAPHATINIKAKTTDKSVADSINFSDNAVTDPDKKTVKSITVSDTEDKSVDFNATGTKTIGKEASGVIVLSNDDSSDDVKILSGTGFSVGSCTYSTQKEVVVPGASVFRRAIAPGTVKIGVTATSKGAECNVDSGQTMQSPIDGVSATTGKIDGGESREVKIVTQEDVQRAASEAMKMDNNAKKDALRAKFSKTDVVIDDSFNVSGSEPAVTPAVGQEAPNGKANLKTTLTLKMTGMDRNELDKVVQKLALQDAPKENGGSKVYDSGIKNVSFSNFGAGTVKISTVSKIGPDLSENDIKNRSKGKIAGEIQQDLLSINGVNDVSVDIKPFWISKVPNDDGKIKINFKVSE